MNINNLIEMDNGLKIFDNKYRVIICYLLYGNNKMNFNSIRREVNIVSGKLAHHLSQLVELGFIEKEKLENGIRGESSYSLTTLGQESIRKLTNLSLQEKPKIIAPQINDLIWSDRLRSYENRVFFKDVYVDTFLRKAHNIWVKTPQMLELLKLLEDLLNNRGAKLYLKGASFTGKSSTIYDFLKSQNALDYVKNGYGYKNGILSVESPLEPDLDSLYHVFLGELLRENESIFKIFNEEWSFEQLKMEVIKRFETTNLRLIIIDDINYLAHYDKKNIQKIIKEILKIGNQFNASIVLVDLENNDYEKLFPEIFSDFNIFLLKKLTKNGTKEILSQFEEKYDMGFMKGLVDLLDSVYKASKGKVGRIDRILRETGLYALRHGKSKLDNALIHKTNKFWYHEGDKKDCSLCGFKADGKF